MENEKRIHINFNEYLKTHTYEDICDLAAIELELGCPHIIITDTLSNCIILEVDHDRNFSQGLLTDFNPHDKHLSYFWSCYCEKHPYIFDNLTNKNVSNRWLKMKKQ